MVPKIKLSHVVSNKSNPEQEGSAEPVSPTPCWEEDTAGTHAGPLGSKERNHRVLGVFTRPSNIEQTQSSKNSPLNIS